MVEKTCKIFPNKKLVILIMCIFICSNSVGCAINYKTESLAVSHGLKNSFVKIVAGYGSTYGIKENGSLWGWGRNNGSLGDGTIIGSPSPIEIISSGVIDVSSCTQTIVLKKDGSLWSWGNNTFGQLGDGTYTKSLVPKQIIAKGVKGIAAGAYYNLAIKSDGSLWAWGTNENGELGDGTTINCNTPKKIIDKDVKAVAAGGSCTYILKTNGSVWSCGNNKVGQLGDGTTENSLVPKQIFDSGVKSIIGGFGHAFVIKTDGTVWAWGQNHHGQLGNGTSDVDIHSIPKEISIKDVKEIKAGTVNSLAIKSDGSLWSWGSNEQSYLCDGTRDDLPHPTPKQVISSDIKAIAAGFYHTVVLKTDGTLWIWGDNRDGTLGDETMNIISNSKFGGSSAISDDSSSN